MNVRLKLIGVLLGVAACAGCGAPGTPQPPSLELPRTVQDLTVSRKGNKITLVWSMPTQTTDGQNIRRSKLGPAQVCRAVGEYPMRYCMQFAGEISAEQIPLAKPGEKPARLTFVDTLAPQVQREHPTEFASYAVSMSNWRGRSAGLSNQVRVPLAPTIAAPENVKTDVRADKIAVTWKGQRAYPCSTPASEAPCLVPGLEYRFRIYRRTEGNQASAVLGEAHLTFMLARTGTGVFDDSSFEWEKTYYYRVTPVTVVMQNGHKLAEVEGEDSPEIKITAHDVFPPVQPGGLQAVFSGPGQKLFIDLTWAPNTEADLNGYNVYRHEQGQAPVKINGELVKTPAYRDEGLEAGRTYFYSVTAVDARANESAKSDETSERVP
jgi:hypothetical protein